MAFSVRTGLILVILLAVAALGVGSSAYSLTGRVQTPVVKSGSFSCILKAGDLDTANECVVSYGSSFKSLLAVVPYVNPVTGHWNQSYGVFQGSMVLPTGAGPIGNSTDFLERGYAGVGELLVHFQSTALGACEPNGVSLVDQMSSTGGVGTWSTVISVPLDCSNGYSIWGTSGFNPTSCSNLIGVGSMFDCWANVTLPFSSPCGGSIGGLNCTLAKNFQNSFNRLVLSGAGVAGITLYRVDLNLVYAESFFCTVIASTVSNFTPECGPSMSIQLTKPIVINGVWLAFGT